jgi:PKD repeat protein
MTQRPIRTLAAALVAASAVSCGSTDPNLPPTAEITSPASGATFFAGDPVTFTGTAEDPETGPLAGSRLSWSSSLDGPIGTGGSLFTGLGAGAHTITLTATDPGGASGTDAISIEIVVNQPPVVSISSPADGAEVVEGLPVSLTGAATDPESGPVPGSRLSWISDRDGALGTGAAVETDALSLGNHVVTLRATDDRGLAGTASFDLTVLPNTAPSAAISAPEDGAEFLQGTEVTFVGSGSDPQQGALTGASLSWSSDRDGALGTETSLGVSDLSAGVHVVTLTAADQQGLTGTASILVIVTTPTGLPPEADFTVACSGLDCDFSSTGSSDPDGLITAWNWEFGDGETSTEQNPSHTFATGGPYTVTLVVTDDRGNVSEPATDTAYPTSPILGGFQVEVRTSPGSTLTAAQRTAVETAVARWSELITGDTPETSLVRAAGTCGGAATPALDEVVDDLVIYLEFESIDGAGGTLGSAGPCIVRSIGLPVLGGMRFDTADLETLESLGLLDEVILHEMGHVLGFGTLWDLSFGATVVFDFLQDPTPASGTILDTHFDGPFAIAAFDEVSDPDYTAGAKVPVENDNEEFGPGSLNGHWREGIFTNELMSPRINLGGNPLSRVTVESLRDMGYVVNAAAADPYSRSFNLVSGVAEPGVEMGDDIWRGPVEVVDAAGRTIDVADPGP